MHQLWFSPLLAAALVGTASDKREAQPIAPEPSDVQSETLALDRDAHSRLTVPVSIAGAGPYDFMIDTGAQATVVTREISEQLQFQPLGTARLIGMASTRPVELVEIDELQMGNRKIYNLAAPVLEREHVGADGIIGLDSLQDLRVIIDFRKDMIEVVDTSNLKNSNRGYEIIVSGRRHDKQLIISDAVLDGVRTTVVIDTGAQASLGNMALKEKLRMRQKQDVVTQDVHGVSAEGEASLVKRLVLQRIALTNVPVTFIDTPAFEAMGLDDKPVLWLGMQHLRMFKRVAIDFSSNEVLFDLPRGLESDWRTRRYNTGL